MTIVAASFFTGVGGLDLAAIAAGFDVRYMTEIDDYNRAVLQARFPQAVLYGDIKHVTGNDIPDADIIFGGFPCTDISSSNRFGRGIEGTRSGLWFQLARIIGESRPTALVLENVSAISFRGGTTVTAHLASMGYDSFWFTVPASIFGSPQHRTRWFLLGYANGNGRPKQKSKRVNSAQVGTCRHGQQISQRGEAVTARQGVRNGHRDECSGLGNESRMGRNANGLPAWMDITKHQFPAGSWLDQKPGEPPRLALLDDEHKHRVKALGNAVVPQQAYPAFKVLYEYMSSQEVI